MLFLSGLVSVVELLPCGYGCTEMDLVSGVTEQELQMLFLCHLHLTGMSWLLSSPMSDTQVCRHLGFTQSAANVLVACLLFFPEGRSLMIQVNPSVALE